MMGKLGHGAAVTWCDKMDCPYCTMYTQTHALDRRTPTQHEERGRGICTMHTRADLNEDLRWNLSLNQLTLMIDLLLSMTLTTGSHRSHGNIGSIST